MARPINDDIAYIGSDLVLAVKFPKVDDKYSFTDLWTSYIDEDKKERRIKIYYYIINTTDKYEVPYDGLYKPWDSDNPDYNNMYAFTIDTSNFKTPGVLMVEIVAEIPAHDNLPARTEIARCSSGIAIME